MSASVKIRMTIEVTTGSSYGDDWKLADVYTQVRRESQQMVHDIFEKEKAWVKIVGEPVVTVVNITENDV